MGRGRDPGAPPTGLPEASRVDGVVPGLPGGTPPAAGTDPMTSPATLTSWEPRWRAPTIESACPSCGRIAARTSGAWSSRTDGTLHARMSCEAIGHEDKRCYRTWDEVVRVLDGER